VVGVDVGFFFVVGDGDELYVFEFGVGF